MHFSHIMPDRNRTRTTVVVFDETAARAEFNDLADEQISAMVGGNVHEQRGGIFRRVRLVRVMLWDGGDYYQDVYSRQAINPNRFMRAVGIRKTIEERYKIAAWPVSVGRCSG